MFKVTFKNPRNGWLSQRVMREVTIGNLQKSVDHLEDVTPIAALPEESGDWVVVAIEEVVDYDVEVKQ